MTKAEIEAVIERVKTWPDHKKAYAAFLLLDIEQGNEMFELTDDDRAAIDEAIAEADRGEFASDAEVAAVFNRYRS